SPASSVSTSSDFGASGSRRGRFGANEASGTRSGPSAKRTSARTAASFRAIVAGASFGRRRPSSDAYSENARTSTSSSSSPRLASQLLNCRTSTPYARRVDSESAGLSRNLVTRSSTKARLRAHAAEASTRLLPEEARKRRSRHGGPHGR